MEYVYVIISEQLGIIKATKSFEKAQKIQTTLMDEELCSLEAAAAALFGGNPTAAEIHKIKLE